MTDKVDPEIAALGAVVAALTDLENDEARQRVIDFAAAKFGLKVSSGKKPNPQDKQDSANLDEDEGDAGDLYSKFNHDKPFENVALIVAKHYSQYGTSPFTVAQIQAEASSAGLTVPNRVDMTLKGAGQKGKRYYQRVGKGTYRVTVNGESFLKTTYAVKKGKQKPPQQASE